MSAKKIHGSSIIGQQGVNLIERVVLGMGFACTRRAGRGGHRRNDRDPGRRYR